MPDFDDTNRQDKVRWPGSGSAITTGSTPWGYFESDPDFITDAPKAAMWAAERLGYPIVDVEMIDINFYACYEEAILEYGAQVNQFNIRNNMLLLQGQPTTSDFTQRNVQGMGIPQLVFLSAGYGTEVGVGGFVDWKHASFEVSASRQEYDLQEIIGDLRESGSRIEIRRVFHDIWPAFARIYDPFSMTGMSYSNILNEMGFAGYSPATQFLMTPIFEDLLRGQAIEFNDLVRKSAWSFQIINNKLRIFPVPTINYTCWIDYSLTNDSTGSLIYPPPQSGSVSNSEVSDQSNAPYSIIPYQNIREVGRQWIRKYFLALCKELLGAIRQKYQTIPVPGAEVTLDGGELRQEAQTEKDALITQLRENLEASGRKAQMENKAQEAEQLRDQLSKIPLPIYIGE
jgi:hypothetical protein